MDYVKNCAFSSGAPFSKQLEEWVVTGGSFAIAAASINALVLLLTGVEDVKPGVIAGSSMAFSACGIHRLQHAWRGDRMVQDWSDLEIMADFSMLFIFSTGLTYLGLRLGKYPVKKWEMVRMDVLSLLAMGGISKMMNEKAV